MFFLYDNILQHLFEILENILMYIEKREIKNMVWRLKLSIQFKKWIIGQWINIEHSHKFFKSWINGAKILVMVLSCALWWSVFDSTPEEEASPSSTECWQLQSLFRLGQSLAVVWKPVSVLLFFLVELVLAGFDWTCSSIWLYTSM